MHFDQATLHKWMTHCIRLAEQALPTDVPVGAILLDDTGRVIAEGFNTRERDNSPLGHAELNVLAQAAEVLNNWRLDGCTLFVTLEPCPMCAGAIEQARIKQVIFGATDPLQGACGSQHQLLTKTQVLGGILEQPCQQQLHTFFQNRRNR